MSNEVDKFKTARDAHDNAKRNGVKGQDLAVLKAAKDAAAAACPGGKPDTSFLG